MSGSLEQERPVVQERLAETRKTPRVLAFEMQTGGHHPSYIRNFASMWCEHDLDGEIDFLVTPEFFSRHADVVDQVGQLDPGKIRIHSLTDAEATNIESKPKLREFKGWKVFCRYAEQWQVDHGLMMYADRFLLPMLLGRKSPCPLSMIYFRPTFHYQRLANYQPTFKQRLVAWRKQWLLGKAIRHDSLDVLFSLDTMAIDYIREVMAPKSKVLRMPDSFARHPISDSQTDQLRNDLGIEDGRRVLMLLGILDPRKGPVELLDAVAALSSDSQCRLCLLLIGRIDDSIRDQVLAKIDRLKWDSGIQVIMRDEYIKDTDVQAYYQVADVALTTYQRHMGMSSALIRAGLAGIPVLSSDYGLMGDLVSRLGLGVTTDTTEPDQFTAAIERVLGDDLGDLFDAAEASRFAEENSPDALAGALNDWLHQIA